MIREFLRSGEREWRRTESSFRLARDRSNATVMVRVVADERELDLTLTWLREPPDTELTDHKISRRWYHFTKSGGRWSIEYGYDGRWWVLFGPNGIPWGETLQRTVEGSLIEATEYIARQEARVRDHDQPTSHTAPKPSDNCAASAGGRCVNQSDGHQRCNFDECVVPADPDATAPGSNPGGAS